MKATQTATAIPPLTSQQERVWREIADFTDAKGFPPTVTELSRALRFKSVGGATIHVKALIKKGYVSKAKNVARGFRLLRHPGKNGHK